MPGDASPLKNALFTAVVATVLYAALLICSYGFISLLTDRDVISQTDVGPLVGPVMAAFVCVLVFLSVLFSLRPRRGPFRLPWARAIATALGVYLAGPAVGGIVVAFDRVDLVAGLLFFGENVVGPFVIASAIIAIPVVLLAPLLSLASNRPR